MAITQVSNSLVKQDLTISGGTVDNTVIGSGTPAAGTFTTVAGTLASTVTGTTAAASDNSTKIATTAYVTTAIANLVDSAPGTLNTLNELAAALGDDASFATTVTNSIATKLPLAGGTLTGATTINGGNPALVISNSGDAKVNFVRSSNTISYSMSTTASGGHGFYDNDRSAYDFYMKNGNVAIGNTSPQSVLHVKTAVDNSVVQGIIIERSANSDRGYLNYNGGAFRMVATDGDPIRFGHASSSDQVTIDGNGNVGIGVSSPASSQGSAIDASGPLLLGGYINSHQTSKAVVELNSNEMKLRAYGASSGTGFMTFATGGGGGSADSERMRIDSSGNVGIGSASPNSYAGQTALTINSTGVSRLDLDIGNTLQGYLLSESGYISLYAAAGGSVRLGVAGASSSVRIDSSGNVGINTTTPSEKLEVSGSINTTNQSTSFSAGLQRGFMDMVSSSKHVRIGSLPGAATPSGTEGTIELAVNGGSKVVITPGGDVGIGNTSPLATHTEGITLGPRTVLSDVVNYQLLLANNAYYKTGGGGEWKSVVAAGGGYSAVRMYNGLFRVHSGTVSAADETLSNMDGTDIRLQIGTDGNVGIGTTSPDVFGGWNRVLHLHGTTGSGSHLRFTDTTTGATGDSGLGIGQYQSDSYFINRENGRQYFYVNNTIKMLLSAAGNLGLGTNHEESRRGLGIKGSSPGIHLVDSDVTNLRHEILGGGNAGLEISADYNNVGTGYIRFDVGGVEKARILESGGIAFNGDTGAQNGFDDYEEGSWTAALASGGGSLTSVGGSYTKIGRFVHLRIYIQSIAPTNNSSNFYIYGLPFVAASNSQAGGTNYGAGSFSYVGPHGGDVTKYGLLVAPGQTYVYFHFIDGSSGGVVRNDEWISNMGTGSGRHLIFEAQYVTPT